MDEKNIQNNDEIEIDLRRIFASLVKKSWLMAAVALICAVTVFLGTLLFVTPTYQASAMFYVNNNSIDVGNLDFSITSSDISASRGLVKLYIIILNTRETLNDVIDYADLDLTYSQLTGMISAEAVDETEIFRVTVTSEDPQQAEAIADAIAYILPKRINTIIDGTTARIVDSAVTPTAPSSPNYVKNALIGLVAGLGITAAVIVVLELLNTSVRTEEDITQSCTEPVLAAVPDMEQKGKATSHYAYATNSHDGQKNALIGRNISFAASEAYKLLRTKLQFSFSDEKSCHVIGVSSALVGEGKSLTAVNLSHSLAQLGKRVLLVDCDLRKPTLADKLPLKKNPGLSDFLSGQSNTEKLIQLCGVPGDERSFHVIASGTVPPNPMELLSSARMEKMVKLLSESYDYIIMDLPPVIEVSDAMAVARLTDGVLLVVRQNYCERGALAAAVRQFKFVNARILGVVFNCTNEDQSGLHKRYYNKYYNRYYGKNGKKFLKTYIDGPDVPFGEQEQ